MQYFKIIAATFFLLSIFQEISALPIYSLDECPKEDWVNVFTLDDQFYPAAEILSIDESTLLIKAFDKSIGIEKNSVFRLDGENFYCSDLRSEEYNIGDFSSPSEYKQFFTDFVLTEKYDKVYGTIVDKSDYLIQIKNENDKIESYEIDQVLAYRISGKTTELTDESIPPDWLIRIGGTSFQKGLPVVVTLGIGSPLNIFPQVSAGFETNLAWPVFFGARTGLSGQFITAGWVYLQGQVYAGFYFPDIAYLSHSLAGGYIYRLNQYNENAYWTNIEFAQQNIYLAYRLHFKRFLLEIGWEFPNQFRYRYPQVSTTGEDGNPITTTELNREKEEMLNFANSIQDFSRFYFWVGYKMVL